MTLVLKCISVYACVAVVCKRNTIHGKDCRESVRSAVSRGDGKHGSFIRGNEIERIERMSALHIYICVMGVLCAVCNCRQPFTLQTLCINVCVCNNSCSTLGVVADFVCFFFSYIFLISTILYDVSLPPLAMDHLDALHSSSIRGDHAIGYNIRTHTRLMSVKCEGRGARINSRGTDFSSVTSSSFFLPSSQS